MKFMECRTILATQLLNVKTDNLEHLVTKTVSKLLNEIHGMQKTSENSVRVIK